MKIKNRLENTLGNFKGLPRVGNRLSKRSGVQILALAVMFAFVFQTSSIQLAEAAVSSTWSHKSLQSSTYSPYDASIAVASNGYLYVAAQEQYTSGSTTYSYLKIYRSINNGGSWSAWKTYSSSTYSFYDPDIAVDIVSNDIYVAYRYYYRSSPYTNYIKCKRITQAGSSYTYTVGSSSSGLYNPSIAVEWKYGTGNYVFVAYDYYISGGDYGILVRKSTDDAASWSTWATRSYSGYDYRYPDLAIDPLNGGVYLAYQLYTGSSYYIYTMAGYATGSSTSTKYISLVYSSTDACRRPSIAISRSTSSPRVAVAWDRYTSSRYIQYLRYATVPTLSASPYTPSWSSYVYIESSTARNALGGQIAVDGTETTSSYNGYFWIVYYEYNEGGTAYQAYTVKRASYSSLSSWTEYQKSTSYYPYWDSPRVFGITTFTKGGTGGYGPAIAFKRGSSNYLYTAGDYITLNAPTLTSPAYGSTTGDYTPTLTWSSVSGTSYYRMIMRKGSTGGTTVRDITTTGTSYTPNIQSYGSDDYWWYVISYDSGGHSRSSSWSYFWLDITPPGVPTLVSPANSWDTNDPTVYLDWNPPSGGPNYYNVQIDDNSAFSSPNTYGTSNSYLTTPTLATDRWYWRVKARDAYNNWGSWSGYRYFDLDTIPPGAPTLVSPTDGAEIADNTPYLDWTAPSGSPTQYYLQVDNNVGFTSINYAYYTSSTAFTMPTMANGVWYWRVRARDAYYNWGSYSTAWDFNISTAGPSLIAPDDLAVMNDTTPAFNWNSVTSATNYQIQVDNDAGFTSPAIDTTTGTTSAHTPGSALAAGTYYWHVRAYVGSWGSYTADPWEFTIDTTAPAAPTLVSPADQSTVNTASTDLDWNTVGGGVEYQVQVDDTSAAMGSVIYLYKTTDSNFTLTFSDGTYYWRTRARDAAGNWGSWSSIWDFNVDSTAPDTPDLTSPADGAYTIATPLLEWTTVADAAEYQVQVDNTNDFLSTVIDTTSGTNSHTTSTLAEGTTYYWRVRARDAANNYGDWSINTSFTVDSTAPSAPALITPGSGIAPPSEVVISDNTPWFNWTAIGDAISYQLQVDNGSTSFLDPLTVNTTTTENVSWTLPDDTYYWRVRAYDAAGNEGSWSSIWCVTIDTTGPTAPTLTSPTNGEVIISSSPTLQWSAVGDADTYWLQVDTSLAFSTVVNINTSSASYTTPILADGTYYWRVKANDSGNNWGEWTDAWLFTVDTTGAAAPNLVSPTDGSLVADNTPQLTWGSVAGAAEYKLQVDDSSTFTSIVFEYTLAATTYATTTLADGTYYWRVQAKDSVGNWGDWSDVWNFSIDTTPPAAPTLLMPDNHANIGDRTPLLEWNPVSDAMEYKVEVDSSNTFATAFNETTVGLSYEVATPLGDGTYYWRVQAKDEAGNWGSWSTVWDVNIDATPPDAPTLLSPADGVTVDLTPQLNWIAPTDATQYQIQLATSITFSTILIDTVTSNLWYLYPANLGDGTYYWQVKAGDEAYNWGAWSANRSFTIDTSGLTGPAPPTYLSPADGSETADGDVTFEWLNVTNAADFLLQVGNSTHGFLSPTVNITTSTNYTVLSTLTPGEYYWRVRTADAAGNWGTMGMFWTFTVPIPPPVAPTLVSPADGAIIANPTPTLDWDSVLYAEKYQVQISSSPSFATTLQDVNTTSSEYTATTLTSAIYYWRVRGVNVNEEWGTWSLIWSFTLSIPVPVAPTLVAPADASAFTDTTPMLTWNTVSGAVDYNVQIDDNNAFTSPDPTGTVTSTFYTSPALTPGTYYWRVRAANSEGTWGPWSAVWSFTVTVPTTEPATTEPPTTVPPSTTVPPATTTQPPPTSGLPGPGFEFLGILGLLFVAIAVSKRRKR